MIGHGTIAYPGPEQVPVGVAASADAVVPGGAFHAASFSGAFRQGSHRKVCRVRGRQGSPYFVLESAARVCRFVVLMVNSLPVAHFC